MITKNNKFFLTLAIFSLVLLSLNFISANNWTENLNNELIGYWNYDTLNENPVQDIFSGKYNGSYTGNNFWVSGKNGLGLESAGIGGGMVIEEVRNLNITANTPWTFATWIRADIPLTYVYPQVFGKEPGTNKFFGLLYDGRSERRDFQFYMADTWSSNMLALERYNVELNGSYHLLVLTYDGSKYCSGVALYFDNNLIPGNCTHNGLTGEINNSQGINIGREGDGTVQTNLTFDETGFWNRVLNSSEIVQLYNNGAGITYSSNFTSNFTGNLTGAIQWENESILNVNSSNWWNFMNGFNTTHFVREYNKLTISESWLNAFISSRINFDYISNLGFYPSSNPSNFYNASTLPPQSGISFTYYNITMYDIIQTSTSANVTIIALPLDAGKNISIECNLLVDSTATNVGVQLNSTVLGASSIRQVIEYYTSATAQAICQGTNETLQCLASNSAGTITTPTKVSIYTVQSNNGFFILDLKSKTSGSAVNVRAGSWCRSVEL